MDVAGVFVWRWNGCLVLDDVVEVRLLLGLWNNVLPDKVVFRIGIDLVALDSKLFFLLDHVLHGQVPKQLLAQLWIDRQLLLRLPNGAELDFWRLFHAVVIVHDSHLVVFVGRESG